MSSVEGMISMYFQKVLGAYVSMNPYLAVILYCCVDYDGMWRFGFHKVMP